MSQKLPKEYEEKLINFHKSVISLRNMATFFLKLEKLIRLQYGST
jgi:hypothetical protein